MMWWRRDVLRETAILVGLRELAALVDTMGDAELAKVAPIVVRLRELKEQSERITLAYVHSLTSLACAVDTADRCEAIKADWLERSEAADMFNKPLPPIPPELLKDPNR